MRVIDLSGEQFGQLTVLARAESNRHGKAQWLCACSCGPKSIVAGVDLRRSDRKATRSCGCRQRKATSDANRTHGQSETRAYSIWRTMWRRCTDPSSVAWGRYGGRGISVCEAWRDLGTFMADMGEPPSGRTLDRIDPDGNYEPGNCRWATPKEQAANKSRCKVVREIEAEQIEAWMGRDA